MIDGIDCSRFCAFGVSAQLGEIQHQQKRKYTMKKLDLGGISAEPRASKSSHPTVECDEEMATLLEQFALIEPQFKTLKNNRETLSKQIAPRIRSLYFDQFKGVSPETSTMLVVAGGRTIKLITKNRYTTTLLDEAALIHVLGAELVAKYFHQATVLKLDLEKCPADKQEEFAAGVIALAKTLGVTSAVSASQCIQPVAGFHDARTIALTPEQNKAIDAVLPVTAYPML